MAIYETRVDLAMGDDRLKPQLVMRRAGFDGLPDVRLPDGYGLRCYRDESDGAAWEQIVAAAFERETEAGEFDTRLRQHEAFRPERVLFAVRDEIPVATASAWDSPRWGKETGQVHMVAVLPRHRGQQLGYWVSLAVLHQFRREGRRDAMLSTDDSRLPAVKTYLRLGFVPVLVHENQRQRWAEVFAAIGRPDLTVEFADILRGPVVSPID
jgi:mycothiol synthase